MHNKKRSITSILAIVILAVSVFLAWQKISEIYEFNVIKKIKGVSIDKSCISEEQMKVVRGNSLKGIVEDGQTIKVLQGYYDCNSVQRGDIVIYGYSTNKEPIIKIIKGLPGDNFKMQNNGRGKYNILVNDKILKISTGQPYELSEAKYKMLALYEKGYKGIIPNDVYLILGNQVGGSLDSTRFGLVGKGGIIGKVE